MVRILFLTILILVCSPEKTPALPLSDLVARGSGVIRYMGFIKVYDAQLYTSPSVRRDQVLSEESSRCLVLKYAVGLSVDDFIRAAETVLARQHDARTIEAVQPQLDLLHDNYQAVENGDSYYFCYDANSRSTSLQLNNDVLVTVPNPVFAQLYFGIWLGAEQPIDSGLRERLLSGFNR